jgi:hypothetical protein
VRLDVARAAARHLGTDAIGIVLLNTAPVSLAGRVLTSRRVVLDRVPFARNRFESLTARLFQDFRIREHRLLAQRYARSSVGRLADGDRDVGFPTFKTRPQSFLSLKRLSEDTPICM